jgi:hypothetical protein
MKLIGKQVVIIFVILISVVLVSFFSFRNLALNRFAEEKTGRFNTTHEASVSYEKVFFSGLNRICIDSLLITAEADDTLVFVHSCSAKLHLWKFIYGHIPLRELRMDHVSISVSTDSFTNFLREASGHDLPASFSSPEVNMKAKASRILRRLFSAVPTRMFVKDIRIRLAGDTSFTNLHSDLFSVRKGEIESVFSYGDSVPRQTLLINGIIRPADRSLEFSLRAGEAGEMILSPIAGLMGACLSYKTLSIRFSETEKREHELRLEGVCSVDSFNISQKTLSSKDISFGDCSIRYYLSIGKNYLELDSLSEMRTGKLILHPFFRYLAGKSDSLVFSIHVPDFTIDDFYSSLPADLLPHLKSMQASGSLSYRAKLMVALNQPDSLVIQTNLNTKNFRIRQVDPELFKMNSSFLHTVYERGLPVRTIQVGPENPDFLPLDQIPVLLQQAVLTAEDGSFYSHRGFLIAGIQRALAQNIKEKSFSRGGSTITQQLIKNIYLSREKTISRKLEEFILVWLIESNRLVSKNRMFEVYLNIIEWGPGVYGTIEAARFYFDKDVSRLNASECIFLASVIPSPKKFYYRYDREGNLAPFMLDYYRDMSIKLYNKGLLSSSNGDSIAMQMELIGPAKNFLRSVEPITDSASVQNIIPSLQVE